MDTNILSADSSTNQEDSLEEIVKMAYKAFCSYSRRFQQEIMDIQEFYMIFFKNRSFMMFLLDREDYTRYLTILEAA